MSDIFIFGEGLEMNLICFSLEFPQRSFYQLQSYVDNAFILHVVIFLSVQGSLLAWCVV